MHETRRTRVRFVLTNPSEPSRLDDFTDWYDTYAAALTVPGYLSNAFRFENPGSSAGRSSPRYATIYDIVTASVRRTMRRCATHGRRWRSAGRRTRT